MSEFKKFKRVEFAEIREVTEADIEEFREQGWITAPGYQEVSISDIDLEKGSPKIGDMIARNPKEHNDQWLVAEQYFKDNFEIV
jgi:hypothetical protein